MFTDWFKRRIESIQDYYNTTYRISKSNKKPLESSEVMRVVNKFASIFMDADVLVVDNYDKTHKRKTDQLNTLLSTDPLYRGKSSFLNNLCKIAILQGGAVVKKTLSGNNLLAFDLLEPCHIEPTKDTTKNRLNITNFRELFRSLRYNDYFTSNVVTLVLDEINFFVDNPSWRKELYLESRLYEIQDKINNSWYANNMLSSLMNRCSIMFLSRENKNEFTAMNTVGNAKDRTKNFNDAYHIKDSAVVPVGDNMRVLNTTISARATGVFDAFEDTINATCNLLGITRSIIEIQGSTFSNQQGAIKDAVTNGVQSFADKVAAFLTEVLREHAVINFNEFVKFDYSELLAKNLASDSQDVQDIEEQNEEDQQQQTEA